MTIADNQGKAASDLFVNPQQWGFAVVRAAGQPTGDLGLDNFGVPVPAPLALLTAGLLALAGLRTARFRYAAA